MTAAPASAIDVSVVICAYTLDRWTDLAAAVASVVSQEPAPGEVILVIDHAPDLLDRARDEFRGIQVVESEGPRGLSAARNTGVGQARGRIVAFLDDDATAEPGWLRGLVEPYRDPGVLGTGGWAEAAWDEGRPRWFPEEFDWVVGCSYRGSPRRTASVRNPLGCSMSFRRDVFETVGGFRLEVGRIGRLPAGCEETELCIRARRQLPGARIVHVPSARVRHRVRASRGTWRYFASRCYAEGRSKAIVARIAGARDGLSTERSYTLRTLPRGVLAGIGDALKGDPSGLGRAAAIVAGFATTTTGYVVGSLSLLMRPEMRPVSAADPAPTTAPGSR